MNEAVFKFQNFINANFWDWQFFLFVFFAGLIFCFYVLNRERALHTPKIFDFVYDKTGRNDKLNCLYIAAANVLLIILYVSVVGIPVPQTHDEFGYLLAADTFRHGRITNPMPFSPRHFEYFHILLEPVYAAKYPPLQGVFLAAGMILTGLPAAGVWLAGVLSSLSVYWLLRAIFSRRWSLYGVFLWILSPLNLIWLDSYWGGHAATIGGALSAGAVFRFLRCGDEKNLFVWGFGIFLLLNSRLYEGAILTVILSGFLFIEMLRNKKLRERVFRRLTIFVFIIVINLSWIAFFNYSVTGNPILLPYTLHHSQYHQVPLFLLQDPHRPKQDIPLVIKRTDERWLNEYREDYKNFPTAVFSTAERTAIYLVWLVRSPFLLILLLVGFVGLLKSPDFALGKHIPAALAIFLTALLITTFKGDRFLAPVVGIAFVSMTCAARMLYLKKGFLTPLVLLLPLVIGGGFLAGTIGVEIRNLPPQIVDDGFYSREQLVNFLKSKGGKHLVFLETDAANPADARFYVYNEAEINDSTIVWAHKLTETENQKLAERHPDRQIWILKNIENRAILAVYEGLK